MPRLITCLLIIISWNVNAQLTNLPLDYKRILGPGLIWLIDENGLMSYTQNFELTIRVEPADSSVKSRKNVKKNLFMADLQNDTLYMYRNLEDLKKNEFSYLSFDSKRRITGWRASNEKGAVQYYSDSTIIIQSEDTLVGIHWAGGVKWQPKAKPAVAVPKEKFHDIFGSNPSDFLDVGHTYLFQYKLAFGKNVWKNWDADGQVYQLEYLDANTYKGKKLRRINHGNGRIVFYYKRGRVIRAELITEKKSDSGILRYQYQ